MDNIEIERRFLVKNNTWRTQVSQTKIIQQGYLSVEKECSIRVRIIGEKAWLTIKGYLSDIARSEFEYEIPLKDAKNIMDTLCPFKVEKRRHIVIHQNYTFEIDEFFGENAPLVVCELELNSENSAYPQPEWMGEEITEDGRFTNAYLSKHPYNTWKQPEKFQAA